MPVAIWDLPTRIFHWALVALIGLSWWTAEAGLLEWHYRSGLAIFGLLAFRIVWGLIGSSTARFANFVRGPRTILDHLRGRGGPVLGHSPIGALSVIALLVAVSAQVGLGLFASDEDGLMSGPLAGWISDDLSERITDLHHDLFDYLLILIGLHVAAIFYHLLVKRDNLTGPMVTGRRSGPAATEGMVAAPAWRLAVAVAIAVGAVWLIA
jgi:cytochrome b